jgi:ATP-binding cassette subfamily C protein
MQIIVHFLRRYPWQSLTVLLGMACANALQVIGLSAALPLFSIATSGEGQGTEPSPLEASVRSVLESLGLSPTLEVLVPLVAVAFLLKAGVMIVAKRQVGYTVAHVATDLRLELLRALTAARWSYFTRQPAGRAANAIATEADRASVAYLETANVLTYSLEAAVMLGLAFAVSWQATLVTALASGLSLITLNLLVRVAARAGRKRTRLLKSLSGRLTDALRAVKLLKATGREALMGPLLEQDTRRLNRALQRQVLSRESLRALQEPILVWIGLAIFVGSVAVLKLPLAEVGMILFLFVRSVQSINKTQRRWQHMLGDSSAFWSLREMIDEAEREREDMGGGQDPQLERGVSFDGVCVGYGDREVLRSVSLEIPAGGITAIIGASGAGKTTLVDLVTGLVQPQSGEVRIDGVPLPKLDLARWRRMVGYVPQETLILHDSVRANVTLGDPDLGDAEVERALRDAGAWEFVAGLPEGVDGSVGEGGALLSGGQRQRLAIARALVRRPKLMILDEATAALDPETEAAVWATVEKLRGRTTVVAISHQPALVGVADRVFRIEDGRVAAQPATQGAV